MDLSEDLSARVLLKHILITEPPRTPVARSDPQGPSSSGVRRSTRLKKKDADAQTPQDILRRSLKHKIRESITRKSLPAPKLRTSSVVLRKSATPAAASVLFSDGDTPRHLLRNILQTESVKSPVVHEKASSEEPELPSADNTVTRTLPSIELSGLDLPDVTIGNVASTAKVLSRKRPRRSLNVTAFEKRLKDGDDADEEIENSVEHSSLSFSSSTSLSLKTPFVDVQTEKKGLQRKVSNRRKITEEEFGAAVNRWEMGEASSFAVIERELGETTHCEGFTLGLSKLTEPDITADIVNSNTALYDQPDALTSNFSFVATQDKPTVMASQLQKEMQDMELEEVEKSNLEGHQLMSSNEEEVTERRNDESDSASQSREDVDETEPQNEAAHVQHGVAAFFSKSEEKEDVTKSNTGEMDDQAEHVEEGVEREDDGAADSHLGDDVDASFQLVIEEVGLECQTGEEYATEEGEGAVEYQTEEEESAAEFQTEEEDGAAETQTEEEESAAEFQTEEEDGAAKTQTEEEESAAEFQTEEEEGAAETQTEEEASAAESATEEGAAESQSEDVKAGCQTEQEEEEEEAVLGSRTEEDDEQECGAESQAEEAPANLQSHDEVEAGSTSEENENEYNWKGKGNDEVQASEQLECDLEHISRRAHRSEGALILPATEEGEDLVDTTTAGWSGAKSRAHTAVDLNASPEVESHTLEPEGAELSIQEQEASPSAEDNPEAGKETFHPLGLTQDVELSGPLCDAPPEEPPLQDDAEQEEEWEDDSEEDEEFPSKTPAFVREKRNFFQPDHLASPVIKNIQESGTPEALPAAKPKKVRQRKTGATKKEKVLPKTYLMSVFRHFAKTKVSADVYPVLDEIMDKFFQRLAEDLEMYAAHAKRKTIEVEDAVLLLKRQGYVNDKVPVEVLIEKYLRMDQRKILIPIATSGNVVIPKRRR